MWNTVSKKGIVPIDTNKGFDNVKQNAKQSKKGEIAMRFMITVLFLVISVVVAGAQSAD